MTLAISGGEKVGVVGRTGAGKSSVALLLMRLVEGSEGSIAIDGEDIAAADLARHRARITVVPQVSRTNSVKSRAWHILCS